MKVTRNTPDQLVIENNPIWTAVVVSVFGLIFIAIGLSNLGAAPGMAAAFIAAGFGVAIGFNMVFVRRTQLILDRPRNLVELRRRGWINDTRMTWELRYLDHAVVETSHSGDTDTYRAALIINGGMDKGTFPLTLVYSGGRGAARAERAINGWLDSGRPAP